MPRFAYSIASDLVAAFKLPFVSDAAPTVCRHAGDRVVDQVGRDLQDVTTALRLSDPRAPPSNRRDYSCWPCCVMQER